MAYARPLVEVQQIVRRQATAVDTRLRAAIIGGLAKLHRYSVETERALINIGAYDRDFDASYAWPDRTAGGVVDIDSVRVIVKDAPLLYFEDVIGDTSGGRGTVAPVSGYRNRVRSSTVNFASNGANDRSALLYDRDVAIGDLVHVRGVANDDSDCLEYDLWTKVKALVATVEDGTISACAADVGNQASTYASTAISQTDGPRNCVVATADGSAFDGLSVGLVSETYRITVVRSSVTGCNAARLRVVSSSGLDDADDVAPADFGSPTAIGALGLTVTFDIDTGACADSADSEGVSEGELVVTQEFTVTVTQDFERGCCEAGGEYSGPDDDIYVVEVTKGGLWADLPEITVTTVKGLDSSGPTTILAENTAYPIGSYGVTISFKDCYGANADSAASDGESFGGDNALAGLRLGDKFLITVGTGLAGPIRTLELEDDLPIAIRGVSDLDLRLFILEDVDVTAPRLSAPPAKNWTTSETQITLKAGMTAYSEQWTLNGVVKPLRIYDGREADDLTFGVVYVEYREWLPATRLAFSAFTDIEDDIPGQLHPDNPLKWHAYKAAQASNGVEVGWLAVGDPSVLDNWASAVSFLEGEERFYNLVPASSDREQQGVVEGYVKAQRGEEVANFKGAFMALTGASTRMIVGLSDADAQALRPTSINGKVVLATLEDDSEADDIQYTILSVPAANSGFRRHGVKAGDIVRFLYTIDGFGNTTYTEFEVDAVLSESSLRLLSGHTAAVNVAQKVEIWRNLSAQEIIDDLKDQAQSFADWGICAVFPDVVGTAGTAQTGSVLAATFAGMVSGVVPHQGLTNSSIPGYDDLAARTSDIFTATQLDDLASGGVWIGMEDRDGTPIVRHALTTDTTDNRRREEVIRRNLDEISLGFKALVSPYLGRANAQPLLLRRLKGIVEDRLRDLKADVYGPDLGPRIIDGQIAVDEVTGETQLYIDPLDDGRIILALDLTLPAPVGRIRLILTI